MSTTPIVQPDVTNISKLTLVCIPSLAGDALDATLANLHQAFAGQSLLIATPDAVPESAAANGLRVITFAPTAPTHGAWVPLAADYLNAWTVAREHKPEAVLILGAECASI